MTTGLGPDLVFCILRCSMMRMMWFSTDCLVWLFTTIIYKTEEGNCMKYHEIATGCGGLVVQKSLKLQLGSTSTSSSVTYVGAICWCWQRRQLDTCSFFSEIWWLVANWWHNQGAIFVKWSNCQILSSYKDSAHTRSGPRQTGIFWSFWCETQVWGEWFGSIGGWQCKK